MSKREKNVRYKTDTLDKVREVAEKQGTTESELFRQLVNGRRSIEDLYREWKRIEREAASLASKDEQALEERHDDLMDRLDELSAAEEHLLDAIQEELRNRAEDCFEEPKTVPA